MTTTHDQSEVTGEYVVLDGEQYFRIGNSHLMPDFFMSLVGASDHWMFISSSGALTAGRRNSDLALFPYASDDQISAARSHTGTTTLIRVHGKQEWQGGKDDPAWEPFAAGETGAEKHRRNLYKTPLGNKLIFEEVNESLQLSFRYRWAFSEEFGFVRSCRLENTGQDACSLELLDGLKNVLPPGLSEEFQSRFSNLGNAYKKSELLSNSGLGLFYLSSVPTDRAEPSEGLRATTVWQTGLTPDATLLSTAQIEAFRSGLPLKSETDVRGKACSYLVKQSIELPAGGVVEWQIVADVAQDHSAIVQRNTWLQNASAPGPEVCDDVNAGQKDFLRIVTSSDGIQHGTNLRRTNRHLANTVFNVMRGGIPLANYRIDTSDFTEHVASFNKETFERHQPFLRSLSGVQHAAELQAAILQQDDPNLTRLGMEYLPLAFSRRHGDPTRPWNRFSIDLRSEDGRKNLNYQGNWRDIFQNWEALGHSFPEFFPSMVSRFVNATTADGYNPYRVTKNGFEWEEPTPGDPWANIGYWGDHQIIYLLKLLEWTRQFQPSRLDSLLNARVFVYANIPYRIKTYSEIRKNAQDTIAFDGNLSASISDRVNKLGADGKLLQNANEEIHHVTLVEKLLTLSLAKLSNFVPDGGIWLNTQRPEWNDANNALVGNGLSMVTTCYLHRWFQFLQTCLSSTEEQTFQVSREVALQFRRIHDVLQQHAESTSGPLTPKQRQEIVTELSQAGSDYRTSLYESGLSGESVALTREECASFAETARRHIEATIRTNRRSDGLYHAYNLIDLQNDTIGVEHLYEMLEGQVAVLTSGLLSAEEATEVLDALRQSCLYRENQNSYLLYPDRDLPRFLNKNVISHNEVSNSVLLTQLLETDNTSIVSRDVQDDVHFNGDFRNSADLKAALDKLDSKYESANNGGREELVKLFEETFGHRQFTGRSGTFFAYEGLGSIYWHMVSKLNLAVTEHYFAAIENGDTPETIERLRSHYEAIRLGIGAEKTPSQYGAFPTDPYSHTPENAGVKQPGMTGQVKEDILSRFTEVGVHIEHGCLCFRTELFDKNELLKEAGGFTYCDLSGKFRTIQVPAKGFGFTLFHIPVIYQPGDTNSIRVHFSDGRDQTFRGVQLDEATSQELFSRSGSAIKIECQFVALSK